MNDIDARNALSDMHLPLQSQRFEAPSSTNCIHDDPVEHNNNNIAWSWYNDHSTYNDIVAMHLLRIWTMHDLEKDFPSDPPPPPTTSGNL